MKSRPPLWREKMWHCWWVPEIWWFHAPVEVGSLSHFLQGFIHPRWLGMGFLPSTISYSKSSCCFGVFKGLQLAKQNNGKCTIDPPWIQIFWLLNAPLINITKTGWLVKKHHHFEAWKGGKLKKHPPRHLKKGDMHREQKTILGCRAGTGCKWIISPLFNK